MPQIGETSNQLFKTLDDWKNILEGLESRTGSHDKGRDERGIIRKGYVKRKVRVRC